MSSVPASIPPPNPHHQRWSSRFVSSVPASILTGIPAVVVAVAVIAASSHRPPVPLSSPILFQEAVRQVREVGIWAAVRGTWPLCEGSGE